MNTIKLLAEDRNLTPRRAKSSSNVSSFEERFHITNFFNNNGDHDYKSRCVGSDSYTFVFVKSGKGTLTIDGKNHEILPSSIYFINMSRSYQQHYSQSGEVVAITINQHFIKRCYFFNPFEECPFLIHIPFKIARVSDLVFEEMEILYKQIIKELKVYKEINSKMVATLFSALLIKLNQIIFDNYVSVCQFNKPMLTVNKFKLLLEKHYYDVTSGRQHVVNRVQDYAEAFNLHPNYFNHIIKSQTGRSVGFWIIEKTISEAKRMLEEHPASIKEISYLLGFSEVAHFSNYFKKYVGMSPLIFRKQLERLPA